MVKKKTEMVGAKDLSLALPMTRDCVSDIRAIITLARKSVVRHVNSTMVLAYWLVGRRLVVEEQKGAARATYGEHLIERVSHEISELFGNGFGVANLRNFRQFYLQNPTEKQIRYALRSELSWTHFRALIRVGDPKERAYYLQEAVAQTWDTRELERQIRTRSYWRVRENQLPESVVYESHDVTPEQILKDPCVAEFLNLREPEIDYPEVRYSILSECQQLFATKLMPYMPTKAELQFEIERARSRTGLRKRSVLPLAVQNTSK